MLTLALLDQCRRRIAADDDEARIWTACHHDGPDFGQEELYAIDVRCPVHRTGEDHGRWRCSGHGRRLVPGEEIEVDAGRDRAHCR